MNPSGIQQTLGNVCVGLAAVLYAIPLQNLLAELSRKGMTGPALPSPDSLPASSPN